MKRWRRVFAAGLAAVVGLVGIYTPSPTEVRAEETQVSSLVAEFEFEGNLDGYKGDSLVTTATARSEKNGDYAGEVTYVTGRNENSKAIRLGEYGLKLNVPNIGKQYTVSFWAKPLEETVQSYSPLLFVGDSSNEQISWLSLCGIWSSEGSKNLMLWSYNNDASYQVGDGRINNVSDQWCQYTLTEDDGKIYLYKDGKQVMEEILNADAYNGENNDIYLGVNYWDPLFKADIDDVEIYREALDGNQVKALYEKDNPSNEVVDKDWEWLSFDVIKGSNQREDAIGSNLALPVQGKAGSQIFWSTDRSDVILNSGVVTPDETKAVDVTLTARIIAGDVEKEKQFSLKVSPGEADQESLHILQIGDSNTEYRRITQGMNEFLKETYGDYGDGFLTFCKDYITTYPDNFSISYSGSWYQYDQVFGQGELKSAEYSPFGLYLESRSVGDKMTVEFVGSAVDIYYLAWSGAGCFRVRIDGEDQGIVVETSNNSTTRKAVFEGLEYGLHTMEIENVSGKINLYGADYRVDHATARKNISTWGKAGIQAKEYATVLEPEVFESAIKELDPDVVTILLGTNDNGISSCSAEDLQEYLITIIKRVQESVPDAEIWVISTFETMNSVERLHSYWDTAFPNAAAETNVHYWSMGEWFGSYSTTQMIDGHHSNLEYSRKIAEKMYEVIQGGVDVVGREVESVGEIPEIITPVGTEFNKVNLPSTVSVTLNDLQNTVTDLQVKWDKDKISYNKNQPGTYTVEGQIQADEENRIYLSDSVAKVKATIKVSENWLEDTKLAEFTFDDSKEGLKGGKAIGNPIGNISLSEDAVSGKALSLDGTGTGYINVTKEDGTSLLTGYDNLTFVYDSKAKSDGANWAFYAAPNDTAQTYQYEKYIGVLDKTSQLTVERYLNSGSRAAVIETNSSDAWKKVVVVFEDGKTTVYVDGKKTELESSYSLTSILGNQSILQIGKGNWGTGEYYTGLIDNFAIYGCALTEEQVKALSGKEDTSTVTPSPTEEPKDTPTVTPSPTEEPKDTPTVTPSPTEEPKDTPTPAPTQKPSKVTGVKAAASTTSVKLTWKKVEQADGYQVYRLNGKTWTLVATTGKTTYTNKKLKTGTPYSYKICAYQKAGEKTLTGAYSSVVKTLTKPEATKITSLKKKSGKVELKFKNVAKATAYEIYKYNKKTKKYEIAYKVENKILYSYNGKKYKKIGTAKVNKGVYTTVLKKATSGQYLMKTITEKKGYPTARGAASRAKKF